MFSKYQHIERFGCEEVQGIESGLCYVFPKIDGTNGVVWYDQTIKAGSRNKELSLHSDNRGFYSYVVSQDKYKKFFEQYPDYFLYGEWLVKHTLDTYCDDAWEKFYVFDVCVFENEQKIYKNYDEYSALLDKFAIEYIPFIKKIKNGSYENFIECLDDNFLIKEGHGTGEGIVIKNYNYLDKYNRVTWAKIVQSEFKEKSNKGNKNIRILNVFEEEIVEDFCTSAFIEKTFANISGEGWSSKNIPRLLGTVFHDLIKEETWNIIKKYKNPSINFKTLNFLVIQKVKETLPDKF